MVLRLDPGHPLVWRSPSSVQFGVQEPVAVLASVPVAEQVLLELLVRGVAAPVFAAAAAERGVSPAQAEALLHVVRRALLPPDGASGPGGSGADVAGLTVAVDGRGPAARAVVQLLGQSGARVVPCDGPFGDGQGAAEPGLAVVVSHFATVPRRAAAWLRVDVPHLLLEFGDRDVRVGPVVVAGDGPCAECLELRRLDADPAWPAIAAQVAGRTAPSADPVGCATAAALAVRMLAEFCAGGAGLRWRRRALRLTRPGTAGALTTEVKLRRHPGCGCRSPTGIATAPAPPRAGLRAPPTTAPAAPSPG